MGSSPSFSRHPVSNSDEPKKKPPQPTIQWDPNEAPPDPAPGVASEDVPGPEAPGAPGAAGKKPPQPTVQWDPKEGPPVEAETPEGQPSEADTDPDEDPLVGQLIRDKWKVLKRLGAGSFGTVYKVQDVKGGWIEALKILGVDRISGSEADTVRKRFLREAQIMKRLGTQSQHIVGLSTYEEDLESGLIYFLMEFVEGPSLGDALAEDGPFSVERTLRLALQICDGLVVAHEGEEGVVHRDLRAEDVDARTDLFAFGVILYCLLTGRDPWFGAPAWEPTTQIYELMVATERAKMKPMSDSGIEIPAALANAVARLLARDPDDRFPSARELKGALERIAQGGEALDAGSIRVLTEEPGVEVVVRAGRRIVAQGPTPCVAAGVTEGSYRVEVKDPRFEATEISVALGPGAMEDVTLLVTPRSEGLGASLRRRRGTVVAAVVLVLLAAGVGVVRPWGRTLELEDFRARLAAGTLTSARLTAQGIQGSLAVGPVPAPYQVPISEGEAPAVVEDLRAAGLELDTSWEVARLIGLAADAQSQLRYFGQAGEDVLSFAERAAALEPESAEARSLLLKVAERMAWDAEAALQDGSPEVAQQLVQECLSVVPDHPGCLAVGGEG